MPYNLADLQGWLNDAAFALVILVIALLAIKLVQLINEQ